MPRSILIVGCGEHRRVDAGPLVTARLFEPLAMRQIELAMKRGHGRDFGFALV